MGPQKFEKGHITTPLSGTVCHP